VADVSVYVVDPADEGRHDPGPDIWWNESWYLDFVADDGSIGGYTRLGLYPNQGVAWWTAAVVGPDRALVEAVDLTLPLPLGPADMDIDAHGTSVACVIEEPLAAMRVVSGGPAARYDDPGDVYRQAAGTPVHLDLDLVWRTDGRPHHYVRTTRYEIPCRVEGTLAIDDEAVAITGQGQRDHSWAPRDWWSFDWCWFAGRLDDGTRAHGADIRVAPELRLSFGYRQGPGEVDGDGDYAGIEDGLVVAESLGDHGFPTSGTIACPPAGLDLAVEPIAFAPLRFDHPDGRVDHFPRAMTRFTAADGRTGLGWIEWNQVQPPRGG
jgi:hypothetical protein